MCLVINSNITTATKKYQNKTLKQQIQLRMERNRKEVSRLNIFLLGG